MADMDLIPADYRQQARLRRVLRQFFLLALGIVLLVGLARAGLSMLMARDQLAITQFEQHEQRLRQAQGELTALQQKHARLQAQLADGGGLEGSKMRVLLRAIEAAHQPDVWFDALRFEQAANASVHIDGGALGHDRLAAFMRQLAAQPGIAQVQLLDSKLGGGPDHSAVAFTLTLKLLPEATQ